MKRPDVAGVWCRGVRGFYEVWVLMRGLIRKSNAARRRVWRGVYLAQEAWGRFIRPSFPIAPLCEVRLGRGALMGPGPRARPSMGMPKKCVWGVSSEGTYSHHTPIRNFFCRRRPWTVCGPERDLRQASSKKCVEGV